MRDGFILRFLLILLISTLFSASSRFFEEKKKNRLKKYNEEKQIEYSLRQWQYSARKIARQFGSW